MKIKFFNSIHSKLLASFLALTLVPLVLISIITYTQTRLMLEHTVFEKLAAVRTIKKMQVETYLDQRKADITTLAKTVASHQQGVFDQLVIMQNDSKSKVENFFAEQKDKAELFAGNANVVQLNETLQEYLDKLGLQPSTPLPVNEAGYISLTAPYVTFMNRYVNANNYYDMYLISPGGRVLYTVRQENDLGADLASGKLRDSGLGRAWQAVKSSNSTTVIDFGAYSPTTFSRSVMFVGTPLHNDQGKLVGVLAFSTLSSYFDYEQLQLALITQAANGVSGETFLVAQEPDGRITWRGGSITVGSGVGLDVTDLMPHYVRQALAGQSGQDIFIEQRGNPILAAYQPLNIAGLKWAIVSMVDAEDSLAPRIENTPENIFTQYKELYGYREIYLITTEGYIFYSTNKGVDYQTNIFTGPLANSNLSQSVRRALEQNKFDFSDFSLYPPQNDEAAAFLAGPVVLNNKTQLIIAIQLRLADLDKIMLENTGMGRTGETYLVGPDLRMRSDSSLDPQMHSVNASLPGSVARNGIDTKASRQALAGESGAGIITNYAGQMVVSAWSPVNVMGANWAVVAEESAAEAFASAENMNRTLIFIDVLVMAGVIGITFWLAQTLARPITDITAVARAVAQGNLEATTQSQNHSHDETSVLAETFNIMTNRLKQTLESLRISEEKYRAIYENAVEGIYQVSLQGHMLKANNALVRILGYDSEKDMIESVSDVQQMIYVHPQERDSFLSAILDKGIVLGRESQFYRKDGQQIWVSINSRLVCDDNGNPAYIEGFLTDISDRKQAEQEIQALTNGLEQRVEERTAELTRVNRLLQEEIGERKQAEEGMERSEEKYRTLVENTNDVFFSTDTQGILTYVSPAIERFAQYKPEDLVDHHFKLFIHPQDIPELLDRFKQTLHGVISSFEFRLITKDGTPRYVRSSSRRIMEDGQLKGMSGIIVDINERKRAEEALQKAHDKLEQRVAERTRELAQINVDLQGEILERKRAEDEIRSLTAALEQRVIERTAQLENANKELESFSYSVSHDLRAPLRSIDGFSQALLEDCNDQLDTRGKEYLQRVRIASQRMAHLIDSMLTLARLTRTEVHLTRIDLSAMVQSIAEELQVNGRHSQVEFIIAQGVVVEADQELMHIALTNLLDNALKFTSLHPKAAIEFGVIPPSDNAGEPVYFVRDDGAGFDMAYADKLFGAFQRLHSAAEFQGTGVGLATVRRIIHRHRGRIWAEGAIEHGATFYFTLAE